jgi:hypothetical protein
VGGSFQQAGPSDAINIARWDGLQWSTFDAGQNLRIVAVLDLLTLPSNELVVAGSLEDLETGDQRGIAVWDGLRWSFPIGTGIIPRSAVSVALSPDGTLFAAGSFSGLSDTGNARVAKWTGTAWIEVGQVSAGEGISHAVFSPAGELIVSGKFSAFGGVPANSWARWTPTGLPVASVPPLPSTIISNDVSTFEVTPASGYDQSGGLSFQWRHDGQAINDGAQGVSPEGGEVSGATTPRITITGSRPSDAGQYTCTISNSCGSATTTPARLAVRCGPADVNADGFFDAADIDDFYRAFDGLDALADFNNDGFIDAIDLDAFIIAWSVGC